MSGPQKILVGYDETEPSKRALERAADLAKAFGSKLVVASVAPTIEPASGRGAGGIDPTDTPEDHIAELDRAREYLNSVAVEAEYQAAIGEPADAIVQLATERGADLIVVGTRELGTLHRILGQSVSDAVAHHARCDVLIVH
jgi:nucleotide-binding universal stress UspA family protein